MACPLFGTKLIWTKASILLVRPLETNFSEILIKIHTFSFNKMHFKMSSGKMSAILSWPHCVAQHVDDLEQGCSNYIANALELLQSSIKLTMYGTWLGYSFYKCCQGHPCIVVLLTHLFLDKMAAILADDIFKCIFLNENDRIQIQISLIFVPRCPID